MSFRISVLLIAAALLGPAAEARAHCDTLSGPVVAAAREALRVGDVTPVLKWVPEADEAAVRDAFRRTTAVRTLNAAAQELADQFFFETVVRLHRAGEGEPFTGLTAEPPDEAIALADAALADGAVDALVRVITTEVVAAVHDRFTRVLALRPHADESVAAGRQYVAAYVDFTHFVEQVMAVGAHAPEHEAGHAR